MPAIQRIAILPRMEVRWVENRTPSRVDLSKLYGKWYFRPLWWALRKLGAEYKDAIPESVRVEERTINHADIQAMIATSQRAMRDLWDKRATTLIVGRDEMERLMRAAPMETIAFDMKMPLGFDAHVSYRGLRVICVPWLEGWALLPDMDKV